MRALIAGGSIAGLAMACRLTEAGWDVRVLEARNELEEGGRAILLQPNGLRALELLGALEPVRSSGSVLSQVSFYLGEKLISRLDYGELRHSHPYAVEIRPQALRKALAERLIEVGGRPPVVAARGKDLRRVQSMDAPDAARQPRLEPIGPLRRRLMARGAGID